MEHVRHGARLCTSRSNHQAVPAAVRAVAARAVADVARAWSVGGAAVRAVLVAVEESEGTECSNRSSRGSTCP